MPTSRRRGHHLPDRGQAANAYSQARRRRACDCQPDRLPGTRGLVMGHHLPDRGQASAVTPVAIGGITMTAITRFDGLFIQIPSAGSANGAQVTSTNGTSLSLDRMLLSGRPAGKSVARILNPRGLSVLELTTPAVASRHDDAHRATCLERSAARRGNRRDVPSVSARDDAGQSAKGGRRPPWSAGGFGVPR